MFHVSLTHYRDNHLKTDNFYDFFKYDFVKVNAHFLQGIMGKITVLLSHFLPAISASLPQLLQ